MKSRKENEKTAIERQKQAKRKIAILLARLERLVDGSEDCPQVTAAVKAVVGREQDDTYDDVDEHPGSLDLPQALNRGSRRTS
jgi:hypothetical protein